ncbi:MAG: M48 family metallopeptidase [Verrucomicrobiales bacterium]|nr:M48 family metallopeptidase [Verrucomicrobiales bacterium]
MRQPRARRYILRVTRAGRVRVTIPRGGSEAFARRFLAEKKDWIEIQLQRLAARAQAREVWCAGTPVWFRGERTPLVERDGRLWLGALELANFDTRHDWRPVVLRALFQLARAELPALVWSEAKRLGIPIQRVTVRNQRTRWGSCSRKGTISLNWRLIQAPTFVRDYLIIHELAHVREMNHSQRYWRLVDEWFPAWRAAEQWLRRHGRELLD